MPGTNTLVISQDDFKQLFNLPSACSVTRARFDEKRQVVLLWLKGEGLSSESNLYPEISWTSFVASPVKSEDGEILESVPVITVENQ